jgi:hypothetical protein
MVHDNHPLPNLPTLNLLSHCRNYPSSFMPIDAGWFIERIANLFNIRLAKPYDSYLYQHLITLEFGDWHLFVIQLIDPSEYLCFHTATL